MITAEELNKLADSPEGRVFAAELIKLLNAQTDNGILTRAYKLQGLLEPYRKESK